MKARTKRQGAPLGREERKEERRRRENGFANDGNSNSSASVFGILFTGSKVGFPVPLLGVPPGPTQWVLDLRTLAGAAAGAAGTATTIGELQEISWDLKTSLFSSRRPNSLPAGAGLALYVATVNSPAEATSPAWACGCCGGGKAL